MHSSFSNLSHKLGTHIQIQSESEMTPDGLSRGGRDGLFCHRLDKKRSCRDSLLHAEKQGPLNSHQHIHLAEKECV